MNTERTPYYHLGRLCDEWLETDVELDKKYPHGNLEACRFYNLQHAIQDIYIIETGDEYPKLKKSYLIGDTLSKIGIKSFRLCIKTQNCDYQQTFE